MWSCCDVSRTRRWWWKSSWPETQTTSTSQWWPWQRPAKPRMHATGPVLQEGRAHFRLSHTTVSACYTHTQQKLVYFCIQTFLITVCFLCKIFVWSFKVVVFIYYSGSFARLKISGEKKWCMKCSYDILECWVVEMLLSYVYYLVIAPGSKLSQK